MKLLIGGDFCITADTKARPTLSQSVSDLFGEVDFRILNLECPITPCSPSHAILKTGPNLKGDERQTCQILRDLNVNLLTLANNHILDFGEVGLHDTFSFLSDNQIDYVGAGATIKEAQKPFFLSYKKQTIAILNVAEKEWSIATLKSGGANPIDVIANCRSIRDAKKKAQRVICIVHGGHEHFNLPGPGLIKTCRFFAEEGADAIVCHHSHCISGYEYHQKTPIIYGTGNFLFTLPVRKTSWYTGLLAQLNVPAVGPVTVELHPVQQCQKTYSPDILENESKAHVLNQVETLSQLLNDTDTYQQLWNKFVQSSLKDIVYNLSVLNVTDNRIARRLLLHIASRLLIQNKTAAKKFVNMLQCQSLHEKSIEFFSGIFNEHK